VERCGLLETLLSGSGAVCVLLGAVFVCACVPLPPQKWPKSFPFIVEGRTRVVRVLTIRCRANGGGVSEPCSLFLWRRGRRSGPSLKRWGDVLVTSDPMHHGSSRAASKRARRSACGRCGLTVREAEARLAPRPNHGGGLGRRESRDGRGPDVECRGSEGAVVLVRWFGGDDDPGQASHAALSMGRGSRGTV